MTRGAVPVPRSWAGDTAVILAGGPSLTAAQVQAALDARAGGGVRVLAVKDAIRLAPSADLLYACDEKWWRFHQPAFAGPRYALDPKAAPYAAVLRNTGMDGLETDPSGLRTGKNSGYQAINLAVHLGASRVVLLGFDMRHGAAGHHWFGPHPYRTADPPYDAFLPLFHTLKAPLAAAGVEVLNATPGSALTAFPVLALDAALAAACFPQPTVKEVFA